jgi:uncharacterized protein (UPF0548 family)
MLDRKALSGNAYLADDWRPFRKAGLSVRLKRGASLIAIVLLSLGLWIVIWEAATSLASTVLR